MKELELWTSGQGRPGPAATQLEDEGWDGIRFGDSQALAPDCYVSLVAAACATTRLRLMASVTNPLTRHPAVTAAAIASVQVESAGRATIGVGRGDSALSFIGLRPAPVPHLERYVDALRGYLRGQDVPFSLATGETFSTEDASLSSSRLQWLEHFPDTPVVPVDVAAGGPRVLALAAKRADSVTLSVGVDPDRVRWAVGIVRETRAATGLPPDAYPIGIYVPVCVNDDRDQARRMLAGVVSSFARYSVSASKAHGPVSRDVSRDLASLHASYSRGTHFSRSSNAANSMSDATVDAFGIAGPANECVERLIALRELGVSTFRVMQPTFGLTPEERAAGHQRLTKGVLHRLR